MNRRRIAEERGRKAETLACWYLRLKGWTVLRRRARVHGGEVDIVAAVTSLARSPLLPELPTMQEAGIADYEMNTWFGFIAPAGTPPAVVERLNKEISAVVATPAVRAKLEEQGFDLVPAQPPAALAELIASDLKKWPSIIKAAGAKVD